MYLAWYGAERAVVEGLRTDSLMAGNIRVSQALSVIIFITSIILQIIIGLRVKRDPESHVLYVNTDESKTLLIEKSNQQDIGNNNAEIGILQDDDEDDDYNIKEEN